MRLAYLSTDPGIAYGGVKGASVHLAAIAEALAGEGNDVLVLVARIEPHSEPPPDRLTVEPLPGPRKGTRATERIAFEEELEAWLEQRLGQFGTDVLYERLALHSAAGAGAARRLGIPHLVELNAPLREETARYRTLEEPDAAERLECLTLARADVVFAVSPPLADYARERGGRRVEVLQNAVAVERFPSPKRDGDPVAIFAGSLRPWHGVETLAEAWRLLGSSAPPLTVIGEGPSRPLVDGLGATLLGPVSPARVPALLAGADIGLVPYGADAPTYFSPLKLFEYLAAGLATVAADLPAVTAVVDRDTAVVVPRGDADALADAVAALAADPLERKRLGENGRELVAAAHTWRHRAKRILAAAAELAEAGLVRA